MPPSPTKNSPRNSPTNSPTPLQRVLRVLGGIETGLLVGLLLVMIGVAVYQVAARNLAGTGLVWGDEMVRVAVLWITMVGASAAAKTDSHIRIDVVSRFTTPRVRDIADRLTSLFTAVVCLALAWYSKTMIEWDYIDGTVGFGPVPAWICELVIPITAGIIAIRYGIRVFVPMKDDHDEDYFGLGSEAQQ